MMIDKDDYLEKIQEYEKQYTFTDGYKILYCPWSSIGNLNTAFISLNPGKSPINADLKTISDERGNSYEVEKFTTQSPLTDQFLRLSSFIKLKPNQILTGVACPFRGDRWNDFNSSQKEAGLNIGKIFWSKVLDEKIKLIITLGNETTKLITEIKDSKLEKEINSGWGNYNLKRYTNSKNTKIIQLLHLSTFKLFSRPKCITPLKEIFEDFI